MKDILREILLKASSLERNIQDKAILQIALILERNAIINRDEELLHRLNLPVEMLELQLSLDEQTEVVIELCNLIRSPNRSPGMFWAISKARFEVACEPLAQVIQQGFATVDAQIFRQALFALENCYAPPWLTKSDTASEKSIGQFSIIKFLESLINHDNVEIAQLARQTLDNIRN